VEFTLAERLARGPLSLAYALQCATDLATALRQLHADRYAHGSINAGTVLLRESNARLAPAYPNSRASQHDDVAAYGAVLYQLVNGCAPPAGFTVTRPLPTAHRNNAEGLAAAATDLAYRCMASHPENAPEMQKVLMEVRLLSVLSRQPEVNTPERPNLIPVPQAPAAAPVRSAPAEPAEPGTADDLPTFPAVLPELNLTPVADLVPSDERCPKCRSNYVYESKARTWFERHFSRWNIPLCRCHRCYYRYCIVLGMKIRKESPLE
jgi:hypothetical protein